MPAPVLTHDPLCPWPAPSTHPNHCQCYLIARVRADERERGDFAQINARFFAWADHAEAVAARLVEVICEDDVDRQDSYSVQVWQAEVIRDEVEQATRAQIAAEVRDGCRHCRNDIKPCAVCAAIAARIARGES